MNFDDFDVILDEDTIIYDFDTAMFMRIWAHGVHDICIGDYIRPLVAGYGSILAYLNPKI